MKILNDPDVCYAGDIFLFLLVDKVHKGASLHNLIILECDTPDVPRGTAPTEVQSTSPVV
jgi:hypothetical protein